MFIFSASLTPLRLWTEHLWLVDKTRTSSWALGNSDGHFSPLSVLCQTTDRLIKKTISRLINNKIIIRCSASTGHLMLIYWAFCPSLTRVWINLWQCLHRVIYFLSKPYLSIHFPALMLSWITQRDSSGCFVCVPAAYKEKMKELSVLSLICSCFYSEPRNKLKQEFEGTDRLKHRLPFGIIQIVPLWMFCLPCKYTHQ